MKRKIISIFLVTAITASLVAGCGNSSNETKKESKSDNDEKIILTWQSYDSYDKYEKIVNAFQKENPDIEIQYEEVSDFATKILTEATAGDAS